VGSPTAQAAGDPETVRRRPAERLLWSGSAAVAKYQADRCAQLAAAISYHILLSLVPLFTFLGSVAGLLLQDSERRQNLIDYLVERFPLSEEAGVDLERILSDLPTPASVIGVVSVAAILWSASGMMGSVRVGLSAALDDGSSRPFFQSKLVDVLLVLSVAVLLLVSFGLSIVVNAVEHWSETVAAELNPAGFEPGSALGVVVPPIFTFGAFLLLYRLVPPGRPRFRDLWLGAMVAAVAAELVKVGFSYYLATVATYDLLYGSLGSVFAFLVVVYLQASVFLFGAELASAWSRSAATRTASPSPDRSVRRRLLAAARGLFVRT
jgi:membrane protein